MHTCFALFTHFQLPHPVPAPGSCTRPVLQRTCSKCGECLFLLHHGQRRRCPCSRAGAVADAGATSGIMGSVATARAAVQGMRPVPCRPGNAAGTVTRPPASMWPLPRRCQCCRRTSVDVDARLRRNSAHTHTTPALISRKLCSTKQGLQHCYSWLDTVLEMPTEPLNTSGGPLHTHALSLIHTPALISRKLCSMTQGCY